jgi:imidazolonepropionase
MGDIHVITDGALLISDGVIQHVGSSRRLERLAEAREADEVDASGHVVVPAFVDCFTQLLCGPPRTGDDPGETNAFGSSSRVFRTWSSQRLELEGRRRIREFARLGTATIAGSSGYGQDEETELRCLRAMDRLRDSLVEMVPLLYTSARAWRRDDDSNHAETVEALATQLLPAAHGRRLLSGAAIGDEFPQDAIEGYLACAARLGLITFVESGGGEGVEMACRAGATAVLDLGRLSHAQAHHFAGSGTMAVLLPGRTFHGGQASYAPARALIDQGAAVALATGFDNISSPTASIPMVMALACRHMRMTPEEALTAVTVNAAHALGLGSRVGTLQYGMQADLLLLDCRDYREIPLYFGMNPVAMVMRRGQTIFPRAEAITDL